MQQHTLYCKCNVFLLFLKCNDALLYIGSYKYMQWVYNVLEISFSVFMQPYIQCSIGEICHAIKNDNYSLHCASYFIATELL